MIHIERHRNDKQGAPIRPSQDWFDTAEAATQVAIHENGNHDADRDIYGHVEVRAALEKLFHDKCAYCESKMTAVADWEVEHFRPKGRVAECRDHPGYYWLAYDWENLYPACTHCNQRRKDKPRWGDLRYAATGGKFDQFPLINEDTRAMSHNEGVQQEQILLIDPCNDYPEQHLKYDIKGQIHSLRNHLRGEIIIEVCHLKRSRLRDARVDIINATVDMLALLRKAEQGEDPPLVDGINSFLETKLLSDSCAYSGAARTVYKDPDAFGVTG